MALKLKIKNADLVQDYDLVQEIDEMNWVNDHPVYCPIPWCSARNLRTARCGDIDGDYDGIHVARIRYAKKEAARNAATLRRFIDLGLSEEDAKISMAFAYSMQQGIDLGLIPVGRKGRRRLL